MTEEEADEWPSSWKRHAILSVAASLLLMVSLGPIKRTIAWLGLGDDWAGALVAIFIFAGLWFSGLWLFGVIRRRVEREL